MLLNLRETPDQPGGAEKGTAAYVYREGAGNCHGG